MKDTTKTQWKEHSKNKNLNDKPIASWKAAPISENMISPKRVGTG